MAEVDTSIYSKLAPQQSPLQMMDQVMDIRQKANANMQFQQEFRGRVVMGQIMQQSVDPQTGQPDYSKAAILAAQNPDAAWLSPDLMAKAVQMQGVSLDNLMKNYNNTQKRLELTGNAAASLAPMGDSVTRDDYTKAITQLVTTAGEHGVADKAFMDGIINSLATAPQGGPQLSQYLRQVAGQSTGAKDSMDRVQQTLTPVEAGGQTHFYGYNPQTGKQNYIGTVTKTPTVAEQNELVPTQNPQTGAPMLTPRAAVAPMVNGAGQPMGGPAAAPPGPVPAGPSPVREAQLKEVAPYQKQLAEQASAVAAPLAQIERMQTLMSKFHSGWGAGERQEAGRIAKSIGFSDKVSNAISNGDLAATQEFMKYAPLNALNSLKASIGPQNRLLKTEFDVMLHTQPNIESDPKAMAHVLELTHRLLSVPSRKLHTYNRYLNTGADPTPGVFEDAFLRRLQKEGLYHPDTGGGPP